MNIGIDVRKLHDYGIGTHIREVVLHAALGDSSDRFTLFCEPGESTIDAPQFTWIVEESRKYSLREHVSLTRKSNEQKIEIFHSPHYTLPYLLNCKTIVTIHDLIHLKFREFFPYWKSKAAEFLLTQTVKKADVILTVSKTSRDDILELFPAAKGKIEVLYNRLGDLWNGPPSQVDPSALGISDPYLLYVGNFKRHKGIDTLVEAYSRLNNAPQLVLAGKSGELDADLSQKILANSKIRLLGLASGELLRALYAHAMIFVFPSLYEGFGYPPLEAMSCGTPVVSSDAPALKEILGKDAEFFARGNPDDLAQKLSQLLEDAEKRKRLAAAGPKHARNFMSEDSPRKLLSIYRRLS